MAALLEKFGDDLRAATRLERGIGLLPRDYVFCRNRASPRLSGSVIRIGSDQAFKDLPNAQSAIKPGDLVVLGKGEFHLFDYKTSPTYKDIAIVGLGPEQTTLIVPRGGGISNSDRVLVDGVRVDCTNEPLCDIRSGGGIHLRDCALVNYNSGSGGSSALYASFGVVLTERCLFDGEGGRAARPGGGGNALDLRRSAWLYARATQFVENEEIRRATTPSLFEHCRALNTHVSAFGVITYASGIVWLRDSDGLLGTRTRGAPNVVYPFQHATDDLEFIEHVLDPANKPIDDDSRQLAQMLLLHRRLPYWIGLIPHEKPRIREIAAGRLKQLLPEGVEVKLPTDAQKEGERLADQGVLLACEVEHTRLISWFDNNREKLQWDEAAGRYRLAP